MEKLTSFYVEEFTKTSVNICLICQSLFFCLWSGGKNSRFWDFNELTIWEILLSIRRRSRGTAEQRSLSLMWENSTARGLPIIKREKSNHIFSYAKGSCLFVAFTNHILRRTWWALKRIRWYGEEFVYKYLEHMWEGRKEKRKLTSQHLLIKQFVDFIRIPWNVVRWREKLI